MPNPNQRPVRLLAVAVAGAAVAIVLVLLVLESRKARTIDAPPIQGLGEWRRLSDAPVPLTEVAAATIDGRIWVAGGLTAEGRGSTAVQIYDPAEDRWTDGPALPQPVHHSALVSDGTGLWLVGGYVGDGFDRPTAAVLTVQGNNWREDAPLPEARGAGAAAWDGERIVYAGGVGPDGISADVFALRGGAWEPIGRLGIAREHLAATSDGAGSVFVLGGRNAGGNLGTIDVVEAGTVRGLAPAMTPRGGVAAFFDPAVGACLVGGEEPGGTRPEVECLRSDLVLRALPPLLVSRHGLGAAVVDRVVYVVAGGRQPGLTVTGVVEALDLP
jgi:hypothetical protein